MVVASVRRYYGAMKKMIAVISAVVASGAMMPAAGANPVEMSLEPIIKVDSPEHSYWAAVAVDSWDMPVSPAPELHKCAKFVGGSTADPGLRFFASNVCLKLNPNSVPALNW